MCKHKKLVRVKDDLYECKKCGYEFYVSARKCKCRGDKPQGSYSN